MSTDLDLYRVNNSIRGPGDSLYKYLRAAIAEAIRIRFLVAFITESGARLLAKPLREAVERGAPVTILTGTYLYTTEPYALEYLIEKVGPTLKLRSYAETGRSFHPKAYFFDLPDDNEVFISSANLSWTALTTGVEWSYRLRINFCNKYIENIGYKNTNLYELSSKELLKALELLNGIEAWQEANQAGNSMYSSACKKLAEFYALNKENKILLSKSFLLLAGISGTGKTSLVSCLPFFLLLVSV